MKTGIVMLFNKLLELFQKKAKSGEKQQEIEEKKINTYSKVICIITLVALFMCVLASLFPNLAITGWWFDLLDRLLNSIN